MKGLPNTAADSACFRLAPDRAESSAAELIYWASRSLGYVALTGALMASVSQIFF